LHWFAVVSVGGRTSTGTGIWYWFAVVSVGGRSSTGIGIWHWFAVFSVSVVAVHYFAVFLFQSTQRDRLQESLTLLATGFVPSKPLSPPPLAATVVWFFHS
jgi:hypothetical protein